MSQPRACCARRRLTSRGAESQIKKKNHQLSEADELHGGRGTEDVQGKDAQTRELRKREGSLLEY